MPCASVYAQQCTDLFSPLLFSLLFSSSCTAGSYDVVKNNILIKRFGLNEKTDKSLLHLLSAMSASVVATTACNPFDVIKSRYMSDGDGIGNGVKKYKSLQHCVSETFRLDGAKVRFVCMSCMCPVLVCPVCQMHFLSFMSFIPYIPL